MKFCIFFNLPFKERIKTLMLCTFEEHGLTETYFDIVIEIWINKTEI
jgi:hypothetical protein